MNEDDIIAHLREKEAGKDGPLERAAECIEQLLGRIHELEETISEINPGG